MRPHNLHADLTPVSTTQISEKSLYIILVKVYKPCTLSKSANGLRILSCISISNHQRCSHPFSQHLIRRKEFSFWHFNYDPLATKNQIITHHITTSLYHSHNSSLNPSTLITLPSWFATIPPPPPAIQSYPHQIRVPKQ